MTMRLSEDGVRKIDAFWANELGCLPEDFYKTGLGITEREANGDLYAHVFRRLEWIQVDCSPSLYKDVRNAVQGVTSQEWENSGWEDCRLIAGYFLDGALVAAAGFEVWGGTLAHICVTTHAGFRNRGYGRACVRSVTEEAIKSGLVAQYQTLFENRPSIAVARAMEFEEYGRRMFVRCKVA